MTAGAVALPQVATGREATGRAVEHVYLHYDYMVAADGHSHAPSAAAIRLVVNAFRAQGIVLHVDPQPTALVEVRSISFGDVCPAVGVPDFFTLKALHFSPDQPNRPYHYALFGHAVSCFTEGLAGVATRPGFDLLISLGDWYDWGFVPPDTYVAGTLLHELGHNFGLRHGGGDEIVQKPNYLSVMNHTYQGGIPVASPNCAPWDVTCRSSPIAWRIDLSGRVLPTLDERALVEDVGMAGSGTDIVMYVCNWTDLAFAPQGVPVDWDCDGNANGTVAANINGDWTFGQRLTGFDDWSVVHAVLPSAPYRKGLLRGPAVPDQSRRPR